MDLWSLPGPRAFLGALVARTIGTPARGPGLVDGWGDPGGTGAVVVTGYPYVPRSWQAAFAANLARLGARLVVLDPRQGRQPTLRKLAEVFGVEGKWRNFMTAENAACVVLVDLDGLDQAHRSEWVGLGQDLIGRRQAGAQGPGLLLFSHAGQDLWCGDMPVLGWNGWLRPVDVAVWAEAHGLRDREAPLGALAASLAVELCGWRLDLARQLVRASNDHVIDPMAWLRTRNQAALPARPTYGGAPYACPLQLLALGEEEELRHRIWRAQMATLFPWLEKLRRRHNRHHLERGRLFMTQAHQRRGYRRIEDMDFSAMARQLEGKVSPHVHTNLDELAKVRNQLAHGGRSVNPIRLQMILPARFMAEETA